MPAAFRFILLGVLMIAAGCAVRSQAVLDNLRSGMTTQQVREKIGTPKVEGFVRFPYHEREYRVLQYDLAVLAKPS